MFLTDYCTKQCPRFPNNVLFIFYCNNSTSFKSVFCMKTVKSRLFQKYLKRRKSRARPCLSLGWLNISEKKLQNTTILSVQELIKQEKQLVFGPTLTLIFLIFGKCKKSKLHIMKKVGLSSFKKILQKYVYNSTFMFFNIVLFYLKRYSETLTGANIIPFR